MSFGEVYHRLERFLLLVLQLGLLVLVIRQFSLESVGFYHIAILTFFGFTIHYFLPLKYRLPFFLLLSLTGIGIVFGFTSGAWLVGIGLVLIGICHLPLKFPARIALLLIAATFLAFQRADWISSPWSAAIWPILGSIFMFRLINYLYDLRHDTAPASIWQTLSYFFLLPNVCFPLFPVVDYKTFRRNYYNEEPDRIYQLGVNWMFRGITHLILYRFIYYYLTLAPSEVANVSDLVRYLTSNFLLYLRVSGQFHLIVGMLCLFGFNLPETHHLYYLASSFTDFWRRINIYWKDFMMKVFYYPAFFQLRRWGGTTALVLSTLFVFLMTWLLHSYQWFWIRGSFLLAWNDAFFWAILAALVVANSLHEAKRGRERSLGRDPWVFLRSPALALRTAGTFAFICVLWSFWTSSSVSQWLSLWSVVLEMNARDFVMISFLLVPAVAFWGAGRGTAGLGMGRGVCKSVGALRNSPVVTAVLILLIFLIGRPEVYQRFGSEISDKVHSLREASLNRRDSALLVRGYYENLLGVERFNSQLWELYAKRPARWQRLDETEAVRQTRDFLKYELLPSSKIIFHDKPFSTNRWGMRDRDYERNKPAHTYRIALLGASPTMGLGVGNGETFEWLLEERLNREHRGDRSTKYEILNFAVGAYSPLQHLLVLQNKVFSFEPDAVFYVAHSSDMQMSMRHLIERIRSGIDPPYDYLREIARRAEIDKDTVSVIAERRLSPFGAEMVSWAYRRIAEECRKKGVLPVWIFLPLVGEKAQPEGVSDLIRLAEEAGFTVLNLSGVYENWDVKSLKIADWDDYPNAKGQKLIAERLYRALLGKGAILSLGLPSRKRDVSDVDRKEKGDG